jgi:hypothetical protein
MTPERLQYFDTELQAIWQQKLDPTGNADNEIRDPADPVNNIELKLGQLETKLSCVHDAVHALLDLFTEVSAV